MERLVEGSYSWLLYHGLVSSQESHLKGEAVVELRGNPLRTGPSSTGDNIVEGSDRNI